MLLNLWLERLGILACVLFVLTLPLSTSLAAISFNLACGLGLFCFPRYKSWLFSSPVIWLFWGYYVIWLFGISYSVADWSSILLTLKKCAKFLLAPMMLVFLRKAMVRTLLIDVFLLSLTIVLILSYLKLLGLSTIGSHYPDSSVFKSHIETSFLFVVGILLSIIMAKSEPSRKVWYIPLATGLIINLLCFNWGRSGYISLGFILVYGLYAQWQWRGLLLALLSSAVLSVSIYTASPTVQQRVNTAVLEWQQFDSNTPQHTSIGLRREFIHTSWQLIQTHPWLGFGSGSFATAYGQAKSPQQVLTTNPHNEYLNHWVQLGLLGFTALCVLFIVLWQQASRLSHRDQHILRATIILFSSGCFLNSWLLDSTEGHWFVFITVLCLGGFLKQSEA